jgi:ankyrin repeat protein
MDSQPEPQPAPPQAALSQDENQQLSQDDITTLVSTMNPLPEKPSENLKAEEKDQTPFEIQPESNLPTQNPNYEQTPSAGESIVTTGTAAKSTITNLIRKKRRQIQETVSLLVEKIKLLPKTLSVILPFLNAKTKDQKENTAIESTPSPHLTIKKTITLNEYKNKRTIFIAIALLIGSIAIGGIVGYYHQKPTVVNKTLSPSATLTNMGIAFENRNFVAYAGSGNANVVNLFIKAGMSIDAARSTDGWTALIAASFYGKQGIVGQLLSQNAAINKQDHFGETALQYAAATGQSAIVAELLSHGANPNIADKIGRTPLTEASDKGYANIVALLRQAGASTNVKPSHTQVLPKPAMSHSLVTTKQLAMNYAGKAEIGMSLQDLEREYPKLKVTHEYLDGNRENVANIYTGTNTTPSLKITLTKGSIKLATEINVYDPKYKTAKQIGVNSTVGDLKKQYTISYVTVINNSIFISVRSMRMLFELDVTQNNIPAQWINTRDPNTLPNDLKIKRIVLY